MCFNELKEYDKKYGGKNSEDIRVIEQMIKETLENTLDEIKRLSVEAITSGRFVTEGVDGFNITKAAEDIKRIEKTINSMKTTETLTNEVKEETKAVEDKPGFVMKTNKDDSKSDVIMASFTHSGHTARALFNKTTENAILLKGTQCRKREGKNYSKELSNRKKEYLESGVLLEWDKNYYELMKNIEFDSLSKAGSFASGWALTEYRSWKDSNGTNIAEIMGKNSKNPFKKTIDRKIK